MPHPHTPSPWLAQLRQDREHFRLDDDSDTHADVVIVGAGIAGVSTAYAILKNTDAKVLLIDAGRIAHGATGRNAGQVVSEFERPLKDIVKAFGFEMAIAGVAAVESAWDLLEDMLHSCDLKTLLSPCVGYGGFSTMEQVIARLEEHDLRAKGGLKNEPVLLKADDALLRRIPEHLQTYVLQVPHSIILETLCTEDHSFIAAYASKKACMNSAMFSEELVVWMVEHYGDRLRVAEHLPVETLVLRKDHALLQTTGPVITANKVILCTNGFENFTISNEAGEDIDTSFHHTVQGTIGYMAGYTDEPDQTPAALAYYRPVHDNEPYHYLTRRPFEHADHGRKTLICIGGPERDLPDSATYDPHTSAPANIAEELDRVMRSAYHDLPPDTTRAFQWQGLMGYTPNKMRRVGFEPKNPVLLYNLGCNGVGIMTSIYGAKRISQLLSGIHLPPSIFDPELGDL